MKKYRTYFNRSTGNGQIFTQKSQTVPDQAMSLKKLLRNYAKGMPLGGYDPNAAIWDEETDGINPKKLDLVDFQEMQEMNKLKIDDLQQKANEEAKPKKQKVNEVNDGGELTT